MRVPKTGDVWYGFVITHNRRVMMLDYSRRCQWLNGAKRYNIYGRECHTTVFAPRWSPNERALFRKWRSEFMRPAQHGQAKVKARKDT